MHSLSENVHRLSYDVLDNDTITYAPGGSKSVMRQAIDEYTDQLNEIVYLLSSHLPPAVGTDDPIYKYWRKGACFKETEEKCDKAEYLPEIGYTKSLTTSGLEHQIFTFIESANVYLNERQYLNKTDSKAFQLIDHLSENFGEDFQVIIKQFNKYAEKSTVTATVVLFSLACCVFISFGIYYYIGFSQASRKFSGVNRLLVCCVYSINQVDRVKNQDLNTFVESSGASVN
jgi:hypothetical protein